MLAELDTTDFNENTLVRRTRERAQDHVTVPSSRLVFKATSTGRYTLHWTRGSGVGTRKLTSPLGPKPTVDDALLQKRHRDLALELSHGSVDFSTLLAFELALARAVLDDLSTSTLIVFDERTGAYNCLRTARKKVRLLVSARLASERVWRRAAWLHLSEAKQASLMAIVSLSVREQYETERQIAKQAREQLEAERLRELPRYVAVKKARNAKRLRDVVTGEPIQPNELHYRFQNDVGTDSPIAILPQTYQRWLHDNEFTELNSRLKSLEESCAEVTRKYMRAIRVTSDVEFDLTAASRTLGSLIECIVELGAIEDVVELKASIADLIKRTASYAAPKVTPQSSRGDD